MSENEISSALISYLKRFSIHAVRITILSLFALFPLILSSCGPISSYSSGVTGPPNMGGPTAEARATKIATEARGNFYYGRRYYVKKTRFWGYLRKPGQSANQSKLVIFNERRKRAPDRLPETGSGRKYGYDNNYEYRIYGNFSGRTLYEPNSNQFLPEFVLSDYKVLDSDPGWLFSPKDHFSPVAITLRPR